MKVTGMEINAWKLTDANGRTHGGCQWGEGVTHTAPGHGPLCSAVWLHFYRHPVIGLFLNPAHTRFDAATMRLWECRYAGVRFDDGMLKSGSTELTTVREIECPRLKAEQRAYFAIACARSLLDVSPEWHAWALGWLSGRDRTANAAYAAKATCAAAYVNANAANAAHAANAANAAYAAAHADVNIWRCAEQAMTWVDPLGN